ncbi:MAG: ATP-binding protein [Alphaproteobacteria bacterium]
MHDFGTPLAAILASATTLETYGELSDVARAELLASIRDETEHMTRFVANLLDMTRLEAGALRPRLTTLDLSDIVSDAAARAARQAQAKAVRIVTPDGSAFAVVDPVLLERALINILENAISFSHAGQTITMALTVRGEQAIIAITDEGPGIPADALDLVFEKFYRAGDQAGQRRGCPSPKALSKPCTALLLRRTTRRTLAAPDRQPASRRNGNRGDIGRKSCSIVLKRLA